MNHDHRKQQPPSPQVMLSLLHSYSAQSPADFHVAVEAAREFRLLASRLHLSVAQRIAELLPRGLQCALRSTDDGGALLQLRSHPMEHLLAGTRSGQPRQDRLQTARQKLPLASGHIKSHGMALHEIPIHDIELLQLLADDPIREISRACYVTPSDLMEWLDGRPLKQRCAHPGCQAASSLETPLVRNIHPYHAARLQRSAEGDQWYCPGHAGGKYLSTRILPDDLSRKLMWGLETESADHLVHYLTKLSQTGPNRPRAASVASINPVGDAARASWRACIELDDREAEMLTGLSLMRHAPSINRAQAAGSWAGLQLTDSGEQAVRAWLADRQRRRCEQADNEHSKAIAVMDSLGVKTHRTRPPDITINDGKEHDGLDQKGRHIARQHFANPAAHWVPIGLQRHRTEAPEVQPAATEALPVTPQLCPLYLQTGDVHACRTSDGLACMHNTLWTHTHTLCVGWAV